MRLRGWERWRENVPKIQSPVCTTMDQSGDPLMRRSKGGWEDERREKKKEEEEGEEL